MAEQECRNIADRSPDGRVFVDSEVWKLYEEVAPTPHLFWMSRPDLFILGKEPGEVYFVNKGVKAGRSKALAKMGKTVLGLSDRNRSYSQAHP